MTGRGVVVLYTGAVLYGLAVGLLVGQSPGSKPPKPIIAIELPDWGLPNGVLGATLCSTDNEPVVLLRADMDSTIRTRVLAHETIHVRQIRSTGDCHAAANAYERDPDVRLAHELEAYCEDARTYLASIAPNTIPDIQAKLTALLLFVTQRADSTTVARAVATKCPLD